MNIQANHFKWTFVGRLDMKKVIPSSNEGVHYVRVSKVSSDLLDFFKPSSCECYEIATNHDLVAPGLSSSLASTYIYVLL